MRFPSVERFHQYCVSKRRAYLRQLFDKRSTRGFFDLWKGEYDFALSRFEIAGLRVEQAAQHGREIHWLLMQDLHQVVRSVVPDFPPAPPTVVAALATALHQTRVARSMLIAGEAGTGKEQLAVLLHVLAGRPGALVRLAAAELHGKAGTPTRQMMPERGSVFIGDLEQLRPPAQEELIAFLNGEARRRDLMFFVATEKEPRSLVAEHGVRRDLFVRVSQTEVRLPPVRERRRDLPLAISDVLYDLARVSPERLPALRGEARSLGDQWATELAGSTSPSDDLFAEALSYVMWRERKDLVRRDEVEALASELGSEPLSGNYRMLREYMADRHDARERAGTRGEGGRAERPHGYVSGRSGESGAADERSARRAVVESRASMAPRRGGGPADFDPTQLSRDDLLRWYYQSLLQDERGDLRRVAARAGRRLPSLHAELARLGVRIGASAPPNPPPGEA